MKQGKHLEILGPVDTAFFYVESAETPMNIGALTIFDGKIDFDRFVRLVDSRIHQAPLYQQRVVQAPLSLGQPMWVFDPDFFIENHIFKITLDAPGTDEQLRELAGHLVSGTLDRGKPLWEITFIEGVSGNRTAIFFKIHHCMVDGLAAVELFTLLLDLTPESGSSGRKPLYNPPPLPDTRQLLLDAVRRDIPHKLGMLNKLGHDFLYLGSVFADKEKRRKALVGIANLINDNLTPIKKLPINGKNTGRVMLAWAEFSLAEVRAIRSNRGASINDVMLTVLGGAVETYVQERTPQNQQCFLRVLVPVNMRVEQEKGAFGNRISVLPVDVPFRVADPLERLRLVAEYTQVMKQSSLSNTLDMVLTLPALAPAITQPLVWGIAPAAFSFLAHTWCTNVAGPQIPVYLDGHEMLHSFGYFPLNPSMGLACVVMSYNQKISMTLVADGGIVPDVEELKTHLENSYLALRRAAKVQPIEPIVIEREPAKKEPEPPSVVPAASPSSPVETASAETESSEKAKPVEIPASNVQPEAGLVPAESSQVPVESDPATIPATASAPQEQSPVVDTQTAAVVLSNGWVGVTEVSSTVQSENAIDATAASVSANGRESAEVPSAELEPVTAVPETVTENSAVAVQTAQPETVVEAPPPAIAEQQAAPPQKPAKLKLFSEEWAQAYQKAINTSVAYRNASKGWTAGSLAFIMDASPHNGYLQRAAVLLDLYRGECRSARSLPAGEATTRAAFVIEGDYPTWMKVLRGEAQPLTMIIRGKLRLRKGSLTKLLPFTQSAQELVRSAQTIS